MVEGSGFFILSYYILFILKLTEQERQAPGPMQDSGMGSGASNQAPVAGRVTIYANSMESCIRQSLVPRTLMGQLPVARTYLQMNPAYRFHPRDNCLQP